jgi:hypothetical protein
MDQTLSDPRDSGKLVIPRAFGSTFVRSGAKGFPPKVAQNLFHYGNPLEWRSCQVMLDARLVLYHMSLLIVSRLKQT